MKHRRVADLHADEGGQMAIFMVLVLIVVFFFFALSFDAGLWYFDHRTAQNQAESAAMAAVLELPDSNTTDATNRGNEWLSRNGADPCGPACFTYTDRNGDGRYDQVRVSVRRDSPGIFSSLSGVSFVTISAAATARIGPVDISNVMPWYVAAPDPNCDTLGETCRVDFNYDGDTNDPNERTCSFSLCPFGLHLDSVYKFKGGGGGNSGAIEACGNGQNNYSECIEGRRVSGFFEVGSSVAVELKPGNMGVNTQEALDVRYPDPAVRATCDVAISPTGGLGSSSPQASAYDPAGKARAQAKFVDNPPHPACPDRLVMIPIFDRPLSQSGGSQTVIVLGIAVFGIANWADPGNRTFGADSGQDCTQRQGNSVPNGVFDCGMVWGYLFSDVMPPQSLLQQIGDSDNPFAPLLAALVE